MAIITVLFTVAVLYGLASALRAAARFFPRLDRQRPLVDAAPAVRPAGDAVRQRLINHMTARRAYRNPDLRIVDVARDIDAPVHVVSAVVNRDLGTNFSDFVNGYRVDEAAELLLDPDRRHHTILSIGLEVGFASKASFNRAFKRRTGLTPSEYQRRVANGQRRAGPSA